MAPRLKALSKDEDLSLVPLDEPVLVELEPGPAGEVEEAPERPAKPAKEPEQEVDPGVKSLKEELRASQEAYQRSEQARLTAERVAADRAREAEEANERTGNTERELVTNSLASAQADVASARAAFTTAYESGDPAAMSLAQEKIGRAAARVVRFEETIASFDEDAQRATAERERPQPVVQRPTDVNAAIDAAAQLLPAEKSWLKTHPEMWVDPNLNRELQVGHDRAIKAGKTRGTPAYFEYMESFMGVSKAAADADDDAGESETPVSAPVSRGQSHTMSGRQSTPTRIHLTPEQREMAALSGLTDVEYARGVQQMEAEKRKNPEKFATR